MIVYHGSGHNFKNLRISPKLSEHPDTLSEGPGIYFSRQHSVAKAYGRYVYTIKIPDKEILDFRLQSTCYRYLNSITHVIEEKHGVNIKNYINLNPIASSMKNGGLVLSKVGHELHLHLYCSDKFSHNVNITVQDAIIADLEAWDKKNPSIYLYTDQIPGVGIIRNSGLAHATIIKKTRQL